MKKAVYLVRTPFQLFNCIEVAKKNNKNGFNIVICFYKRKEDKILLDDISLQFKWTRLYFIKLNIFNKTFYSFYLSYILNKYENIDYCYFGLITSYIIHSINTIKAFENILIDDGNETLLIADNINKNKYNIKFNKNGIINYILRRNLKLNFLDTMVFFTFFDLSDYVSKNKIIKNDYSEFRKLINNMSLSEEIFFIGSNLIDTYISKEYFELMMHNIKNYYDSLSINVQIIYIPHRYEDLEYLISLGKKLGFKVRKFDTILELAILKYNRKPKSLVSFRSTALETLGFLYSIKELDIVKLDNGELLKQNQIIEFNNLYINYKKKNISLITLK